MHQEVRNNFSFRRKKKEETQPDMTNLTGRLSYPQSLFFRHFIIAGTNVFFIRSGTTVMVGQMSYFIIGGTNV
jgi:hypothetical protein